MQAACRSLKNGKKFIDISRKKKQRNNNNNNKIQEYKEYNTRSLWNSFSVLDCSTLVFYFCFNLLHA